MNFSDHPEIARVAGAIATCDRDASVVLIGSFARHCEIRQSDIDILVLSREPVQSCFRVPRFEFHMYLTADFLKRAHARDDFPAWCTRFGIPLHGKTSWHSVLEKMGDAPWPEWQAKISVATRRLLATKLLLRTRDEEAAAESLLFAYDHYIRGLLLRDNVFPLSRPELPAQIASVDRTLGNRLTRLLSRNPDRLDFEEFVTSLERGIEEVAPDAIVHYRSRLTEFLRSSVSETGTRSLAGRKTKGDADCSLSSRPCYTNNKNVRTRSRNRHRTM